jgi:hypothetical protein
LDTSEYYVEIGAYEVDSIICGPHLLSTHRTRAPMDVIFIEYDPRKCCTSHHQSILQMEMLRFRKVKKPVWVAQPERW